MDREVTRTEMLTYCLFVFSKRRALLSLVALTTLSLVIFFTYLITPSWKGTTKILVERSSKQSLSIFKDISLPVATGQAPDNFNLVEVLTGTNMAYEIVREFGLDDHLRRKRLEPEDLRGKLKRIIVNVVLSPVTLLQAVGILEKGGKNWVDEAAEKFREDWADIEAVEGTSTIDLMISADSPRLAMDISNRMAELLAERTESFTREAAKSSYDYTKSQLLVAEAKLTSAEEALTAFQKRENIILVEEEKRLKAALLNEYEAALLETRKEREEVRARLAATNREMGKHTEKIVLSTVLGKDPIVTELESSVAKLEMELAAVLAEKTPEHPEAVGLKASIDEQKAKLRSAVENVVLSQTESFNPIYRDLLSDAISLRADSIALRARRDALVETIRRLKDELGRWLEKEVELARLQRMVDINRTINEALEMRLEKLVIERESTNNEYNIRILDKAYVSDSADPNWPVWPLNFAVGVFLSMILGPLTCLLLEFWNAGIVNPRDIERELSLPFLGGIPEAPNPTE